MTDSLDKLDGELSPVSIRLLSTVEQRHEFLFKGILIGLFLRRTRCVGFA